ncbi:MAG: cobalt-precorrin-5B (C(1))-methyltransferase CbiD [Timaviella obliquedivisa GSE-PSE-MK23-08B]|jgi:cobalt-precorrin-5B (C1)-methyltransferase|nr:cobalt-precorrin-5B (C(1))-methyltransferase CbiD [Timaviella obliquedivisa GSE-PSE-MK23-08B]
MARTGYTLPVFAVASAKAALLHLQSNATPQTVTLDLLPESQPNSAEISIQQVARLDATSALAITLSDPGDNLDLTRNTPIWAWVRRSRRDTHSEFPHPSPALILEAGEGLGRTAAGDAAIYSYARRLFDANLLPLIAADQTVIVSIILPEGRQLAQRTSNEAFGILEGLSLLGTSGISQPLSVADHLESLRAALQVKVQTHPHLVFCLGSNGMQVAKRLGIPDEAVVQTGNWIGALLVEAGLREAQSVLLLGYQGKLIKLAGGIFNTSSHLADAKLEIISAAVVQEGGDLAAVQAVLNAPTADAAYQTLVALGLVDAVFGALAQRISHRGSDYVRKYGAVEMRIGTILCDRHGQIISQDAEATELLKLLT